MQKSINNVCNLELYISDRKMVLTVLNNLFEGVIITDNSGKCLLFNNVAKKIIGLGPQKVMPSDWTEIYGCYLTDKKTPYPAENLPLARALKGEEVFNEQIFIRNKKKSKGVFISASAVPIKNEKGEAIAGAVILHDVTDTMQMNERVKISEKRVTAQLQGIPTPVFIWKKSGDEFILIGFNDAAVKLTDDRIKFLEGASLNQIYHDNENIRNDFLTCLRGKKVITREMSYRLRSTGKNKELKVTYAFLPPDLVMVYVEDASERKNDKQALKKLSNAVEQTADSVLITDRNGIIEYVNNAFEKTTGFSTKEVIGKTPQILKSGMHDNLFYKNMWNDITTGKTFRGSIVNKKKSGDLYWCEQTITPMKDNKGNITNFVSVIKDVTEIKEKREQDVRLQVAREIQENLLRSKLEVPGFDIAGATYPAVETTGDYYDIFKLPDGSIGMVVADVAGHGIGAALIMTQTRAYVRAFSRTESKPDLILKLLNQELFSDLDDHHFVTLIFARLDTSNNILDYASAGHVPAYVFNRDGKITSILQSNSAPLGVMPDLKFEKSKKVKLYSSDMLVFFSDGILELFPQNECDEDIERAIDIIARHKNKKSHQILKCLHHELQILLDHKPQLDDMTSLICRVL